MQKKYIIRLTDQERITLTEVIKKLKGTGSKVRRAHILLKADADGAAWTDRKIADAYSCRTKTVENVRQRFVERGFEETLDGKKRSDPPTDKLLDGEQEAKIIATRLATGRLCQLDIATARKKSRRIGNRRVGQSTDIAPDAKKTV